MSRILLELKSDLCAGTGTGYSSLVDIDISYDRYGIPFIPGRRLKGCLREAAEYYGIEGDLINRLFGSSGEEAPGVLKIGNGELNTATLIHRYIDEQNAEERPTPAQVLDVFTRIYASTAIDEKTGTAQKETLRFARLLNQKFPTGENLCFVFPCEDDGTEETCKTMANICRALRNIGMERSRGLGAVRCTYDASQDSQPMTFPPEAIEPDARTDMVLSIHLYLEAPLLITGTSGTESMNYVSGTALLGALASLYLKKTAHHQADELFNALFLSGRVTYSNLYISDQNRAVCVPAPYYIRELKSSDSRLDGKLITFFEDKEAFVEQAVYGGNCPEERRIELQNLTRLTQEKPLRGKMLNIGTYDEYKVKAERTYHHSVHGNNRQPYTNDDDASLYTQTCICAGQYLLGSVTGPEPLLEVLRALLDGESLRLGMSRSAQYSRCVPVKDSLALKAPTQSEKIDIPAGGSLVVVLESDVIPREQGDPVGSILAEILPEGCHAEIDYSHLATDYHMIHGFHARRGLRNMPVRAMLMGSTITVIVPQAVTLPGFTRVGARQAEGFGCVRLQSPEALAQERHNKRDDAERKPDLDLTAEEKNAILWFVDALGQEKTGWAQALGREVYGKIGGKLTGDRNSASFVGRLMLMTKEAQSLPDLEGRIASIRDDGKKGTAKELLSAVREKLRPHDAEGNMDVVKICMMTALRLAKYDLKKEGIA